MLEVTDLRFAYGRLEVIHGISLTVGDGEFVAVLGSNGAGKSTLLRACAGQAPVPAGSVRFDGRDLAEVPAHDVVRSGLAYAMEGRRIFQRQSVRANLEVGTYSLAGRRGRSGALFDRVFGLFPVLQRKAGQPASTLSGGERQMLAIGQALMSDPRLLVLDEPSAGLAPLLIQQVFGALAQLQREGLALLLAEQTVEQALSLCDRGYVLNAGVVVLNGSASTLRADEGVRAAYIGSLGHGARPDQPHSRPEITSHPPSSDDSERQDR